MNEDQLAAVFKYLKLNKKSIFSTPYFIVPLSAALMFFIWGLVAVSPKERTAAYVLFTVISLFGVLLSLFNEIDKGTARNVVACLIKSYGEENVYNDFREADRFFGDKMRMGKRFVFANRRIIEIKDIDLFVYKNFSMNFIPFYYMLFAECVQNGRDETYLIAELDFFKHRQQTKVINEILNDKKLRL